MKGLIFAVLMGVCVGGYSKTNTTFTPCEKTYVDPFFIDIHDKKIHVEGEDGESLETSALYADDLGLYYQDFLSEEEPEESIEIQVIDLSSLVEEDEFTTDEQLEVVFEDKPPEEVAFEEVKETAEPKPTPPKPTRPKKTWPYGKNR